jgi:hypothetical protein
VTQKSARSAEVFMGRLSGLVGIWKDADPDIPILKQAKAEYAKLQ